MKTELGFWGLLRRYLGNGKRQLFTVTECATCGIVAAVAAIVVATVAADLATATKEMASLVFSASAGLLGVVLAGFAISAAMTDAGFSAFLFRNDKLIDLLSPFWFSSALWAVSMAVSGIVFVSSYAATMLTRVYPYEAFAVVLAFSLALSFTLSLVGNTLKTGFYRAMYQVSVEEEQNDRPGDTQEKKSEARRRKER